MQYLRTADGLLKAKLSDRLARTVMRNTPGYTRPYQAKGKSPTVVFEITVDMTLDLPDITLFLWAGEIVVPEEPKRG